MVNQIKKRIKFIKYIAVILVIILGCQKDDTDPDFLRIGNQKSNLDEGFYVDYGTNPTDISYRRYGIQLVDNDFDPSFYVQFMIYSFSTKELTSGIYQYNYDNEEAGYFSYLSAGINLETDRTGNYIRGEIYDDADEKVEVLNGLIDLTIDKNTYYFDIEATMVKNFDTVEMEAHYSGRLFNDTIDFINYY